MKKEAVKAANKLITKFSQHRLKLRRTRVQLLLRWPRNVAQVEFAFLDLKYLSLTHTLSVIATSITVNEYIAEKLVLWTISLS